MLHLVSKPRRKPPKLLESDHLLGIANINPNPHRLDLFPVIVDRKYQFVSIPGFSVEGDAINVALTSRHHALNGLIESNPHSLGPIQTLKEKEAYLNHPFSTTNQLSHGRPERSDPQ